MCWLSDGVKAQDKSYPYWDAKALRRQKLPEFRNNGKLVFNNSNVILVDGENSGEIFTIPSAGYMGSTFKLLEIISNIDFQFITTTLGYYKSLFKENKTGSAVPHLNKNLFKSLVVAIPPLNEQRQIISKVNSIFSQLENIE